MSGMTVNIYIIRRKAPNGPSVWMYAFAAEGNDRAAFIFAIGRPQPIVLSDQLLHNEMIVSKELISMTKFAVLDNDHHLNKRLRSLPGNDNKSFMFGGLGILKRAGLVSYDIYLRWGDIFNLPPSPIRPSINVLSAAELEAANVSQTDLQMFRIMLSRLSAHNIPTANLTAVALSVGTYTACPSVTEIAGADMALKWVPSAAGPSSNIPMAPFFFTSPSLTALILSTPCQPTIALSPLASTAGNPSTEDLLTSSLGAPPPGLSFLAADTADPSIISAAVPSTACPVAPYPPEPSSARPPAACPLAARPPGPISARPPGPTSTRSPGPTSARPPGPTSARPPGPQPTPPPVVDPWGMRSSAAFFAIPGPSAAGPSTPGTPAAGKSVANSSRTSSSQKTSRYSNSSSWAENDDPAWKHPPKKSRSPRYPHPGKGGDPCAGT